MSGNAPIVHAMEGSRTSCGGCTFDLRENEKKRAMTMRMGIQGVPENLAPIVTVLDAESTPMMYNDPALALLQ